RAAVKGMSDQNRKNRRQSQDAFDELQDLENRAAEKGARDQANSSVNRGNGKRMSNNKSGRNGGGNGQGNGRGNNENGSRESMNLLTPEREKAMKEAIKNDILSKEAAKRHNKVPKEAIKESLGDKLLDEAIEKELMKHNIPKMIQDQAIDEAKAREQGEKDQKQLDDAERRRNEALEKNLEQAMKIKELQNQIESFKTKKLEEDVLARERAKELEKMSKQEKIENLAREAGAKAEEEARKQAENLINEQDVLEKAREEAEVKEVAQLEQETLQNAIVKENEELRKQLENERKQAEKKILESSEEAMKKQAMIEKAIEEIQNSIAEKKLIETEKERNVIEKASEIFADTFNDSVANNELPDEAQRKAITAYNNYLTRSYPDLGARIPIPVIPPPTAPPVVLPPETVYVTVSSIIEEPQTTVNIVPTEELATISPPEVLYNDISKVPPITTPPPPPEQLSAADIAGIITEEENLARGETAEKANLKGEAIAKKVNSTEAAQAIVEAHEIIEMAKSSLNEADSRALEEVEKQNIQSKGYVEKSELESAEDINNEIYEKARNIIEDLSTKNAEKEAETEMYKAKADAAPKNWAEDIARRHETEAKKSKMLTDEAINYRAENRGDQLGIRMTIPDNSDVIKLSNVHINLPLKPFIDSETANSAEASVKRAQQELKEDLRNKITETKFITPLNVIEGTDGYLNVGENVQYLIIGKGTIYYPEGAKEEMEKLGLDGSMLIHAYNNGEHPLLATGMGYYKVEVSNMKLIMPSPSSPERPKIISGNGQNIDITKAEYINIDEGLLELESWKEYERRLRPKLNASVNIQTERSQPDAELYDKALQTANLLNNTRTEIFANPGGNEYVKITPPYGVSEQIPMDEAVRNISISPSSDEIGQDGIGMLQGFDLPMDENNQEPTLNLIPNKEESINTEMEITSQGLKISSLVGNPEEGISTTNSFTGNKDKDKILILGGINGTGRDFEENKPPSDNERNEQPGDAVERANLITSGTIISYLANIGPENANILRSTLDDYKKKLERIPPSMIIHFIEYSKHPYDQEKKSIHYNVLKELEEITQGDVKTWEDILFKAVKKITGKANPNNLVPRASIAIKQILHNKHNNNNNNKHLKFIYGKKKARRPNVVKQVRRRRTYPVQVNSSYYYR
ncbi:MAG: hypothetical protein RR549_01460, partial [Oscillospiraceae bacterium]